MKIFALFFLVVMTVLAFAYADDTCTIDGKTLKKDEVYQPSGKCEQKKCTGKQTLISTGCSAAAAGPHCKPVPGDNSKPYPKCCPSFDCKKDH